MGRLADFKYLDIDWDMTPEEAVTMYLEWGNNWRRGERAPVRSKNDVSNYFVLNTWQRPPVVMLVRRNSEGVEELAILDIPEELKDHVREQAGSIKGVFGVTSTMKEWLQQELEAEKA